MSYTDLTTTFVYKGLLTWQQMDQLAENDAIMIRTDLGGQTLTPATAVIGLTIDQNNDHEAFRVDCESVSYSAVAVESKFCMDLKSDISGGRALYVHRNIAEAGSNELAHFEEENATGTQTVVKISNAGSGYDMTAPNFTLKNGYIAPGGNEALRWDIVTITMDGTPPDTGAITVDETLIRRINAVGWDVDAATAYSEGADGETYKVRPSINSDTITISYDAVTGYVNNDLAHIVVGTVAS